MLLSMRIPSDLVVETCFIGILSIESSRDSDNVLSFCLDPININSVSFDLGSRYSIVGPYFKTAWAKIILRAFQEELKSVN